MQILQVSPDDGRGGAERIALDLHHAYRAAGHDARLVVGRRYNDDPTILSLDPAGRPAPRQGRLSRLLGDEPPGHPATAALLDRSDPPPDVLHLNNLHGGAGGGGGYFDLRQLPTLSRRQPTFITPHDAWLFTGGPTYAPHPHKPLTRRQRRRLARRAAIFANSELHLVTSSNWMFQQAMSSPLGRHFRSARVIPVGVDLTTFHPASPDDRAAARASLGLDDRPTALFVAHDAHRHPFKDFPTVRAAVARSRHDLTLLVAGTTGADETLGRCTVRYLGGLCDDAQLVAAYHAADVLVHAAVADNFPNVILEAMACGLPAVATAVGGIPEQIADGETGLLVPPRDPAAMAAALDRLLDDAGLTARLGHAAHRRAVCSHDLNKQAAANLQHYRDRLQH